jgi:hypothetical protein
VRGQLRIGPVDLRVIQVRTGSVGSRWLAVDEHVVGLVRHIDDRSGPGVAGTGRATPPAVLRRSTSTTCDSRTPMA